MQGKVYFDFLFKEDKNPSWQRGMASCSGRKSKWNEHIYHHKKQNKKGTEMGQGKEFLNLLPITYFPPQDCTFQRFLNISEVAQLLGNLNTQIHKTREYFPFKSPQMRIF